MCGLSLLGCGVSFWLSFLSVSVDASYSEWKPDQNWDMVSLMYRDVLLLCRAIKLRQLPRPSGQLYTTLRMPQGHPSVASITISARASQAIQHPSTMWQSTEASLAMPSPRTRCKVSFRNIVERRLGIGELTLGVMSMHRSFCRSTSADAYIESIISKSIFRVLQRWSGDDLWACSEFVTHVWEEGVPGHCAFLESWI